MLSKSKQAKHQRFLQQLAKFPQAVADVAILHSAMAFRTALLTAIANAKQRIYLVALYLEHDEGGKEIFAALYDAKHRNPDLQVVVLVDWHRAQRGRIGDCADNTNADWYCSLSSHHPKELTIPVYGIPVNTREALGVLHLKGFIIDDTVLYSGASINNVYLHQLDKYRYDRYQLIHNHQLAHTMLEYIHQHLLTAGAVQRLDRQDRPKKLELKNEIRQFRASLRYAEYQLPLPLLSDEPQLAVTPLVGLGKQSILNTTIQHLMASTEQKLTLCTPYFNLPTPLMRIVVSLLRQGKQVEIIVGDKTANDFYIPEDQPFKIIGALPYLYEINLRRFLHRLQRYADTGQLIIRLWKDGNNSYHLKGIWVDEQWQLITGNNLNPRAWGLDLENAILFHDPHQQLAEQRQKELSAIRTHTQVLQHYSELENLRIYPLKIRKLLRRLRRVRLDRLISRIL